MSASSGTGGYHVYDNFVEIRGHSYSSLVKFYELNYVEIKQLPLKEYLELHTEYLNALFELSLYRKYLLECDELIEISIMHNIYYYGGEDLLQSTLLRKAACHYNIYDTENAERLAKELLKINPSHKSAKLLYEKCLMRKNKSFVNLGRGISIVLLLSSAMVIFIELVLIRPFYEEYLYATQITRIILFALGLAVLLISEGINFISIRLNLFKLLKEIKNKKPQHHL